MAEKKYIEREKIEKFFDGIYDCADLTFEPNDHCCSDDDCGHCKWYEAKNAIQKRILSIRAADVRPVVKAEWLPFGKRGIYGMMYACSACHAKYDGKTNFCPNCGCAMEET